MDTPAFPEVSTIFMVFWSKLLRFFLGSVNLGLPHRVSFAYTYIIDIQLRWSIVFLTLLEINLTGVGKKKPRLARFLLPAVSD